MRDLVFQGALAALFATTPITASAAIFDDGNDRYYVKELRAKDPASLTNEEKAILAAANKVGVIGFCNGKNTGNAFLILYRGRPAVVTSAHFAVDPDHGKLFCPSEAEFVKGITYMPNTGFYDSTYPNRNRDFVFRKVGLEFPPTNWENVKGQKYTAEKDFLVFYLQEEITGDRMPDGSTRGYLKFSETGPAKGNLYMLGLAHDMGGGMEMVYQSRCDGFSKYGDIYHGCDSPGTASASLIGTLEDGEINYRGHHTAALVIEVVPSSYKEKEFGANVGTNSVDIRTLMDAEAPRPAFLASDLQWLLTRAGCYSGKLDNQWGPGSRKALAAFAAAAATELPGTEPSPELLAAVEKIAPKGTEVCRR